MAGRASPTASPSTRVGQCQFLGGRSWASRPRPSPRLRGDLWPWSRPRPRWRSPRHRSSETAAIPRPARPDTTARPPLKTSVRGTADGAINHSRVPETRGRSRQLSNARLLSGQALSFFRAIDRQAAHSRSAGIAAHSDASEARAAADVGVAAGERIARLAVFPEARMSLKVQPSRPGQPRPPSRITVASRATSSKKSPSNAAIVLSSTISPKPRPLRSTIPKTGRLQVSRPSKRAKATGAGRANETSFHSPGGGLGTCLRGLPGGRPCAHERGRHWG